MLFGCAQNPEKKSGGYQAFFSAWSEAVKNMDCRTLNTLEFAQKSDAEYKEVYGDHYYSSVLVFNSENMENGRIKISFSGNTVSRVDGSSYPFMGEAELVPDEKTSGFRIHNRIIYRGK